jgi:hydroxymethylbilane synthase
MRVRLLSRGSTLAVLQTGLVERALRARWPDLEVVRLTRATEGDRERRMDLASAADKGIFTADLSRALLGGEAEAVVHSWKDLPIESTAGTAVTATLDRADPRDVLLVSRGVVSLGPPSLTVLSSSPRRAWQIQRTAPRLLPWPIADVRVVPVRGNVPTRLAKLTRGDGDALIVAKAALDRLLAPDAPVEAAHAVRQAIDACHWMVLPIREHPTAPAQGALAIEVALSRTDVAEHVRAINHEPTWDAVERERQILRSFGGGCHEAVGATVLVRDFGRVTSIAARVGRRESVTWSLETPAPLPPRAPAEQVWPRPEERHHVNRRPLEVSPPSVDAGFRVARAEALPANWIVTPERPIWAAGVRTWERLAARGVWVNGCADSLGDAERPDVDALVGRPVAWLRLTHTGSGDPDALGTYVAEPEFPPDLPSRSHFFWTSGSAFRQAVSRFPGLGAGWHASGPGRTSRVIRDTLGPEARLSVWLDYEQWHRHVTS